MSSVGFAVSASLSSSRDQARTSGGVGPGATSIAGDEPHERAALQREHRREEQHEARARCASRGSDTSG